MSIEKHLLDEVLPQEKAQIEAEVQADLVVYLYNSSPTGIISACVLSTGIFYFFHSYNPQAFLPLIIWLFSFTLLNIFSYLLYLDYKKNITRFSTGIWRNILGTALLIYAALYGSCVWFIPDETLLQSLVAGVLLLTANAMATATAGILALSVGCVSFIVLPLIVWFFVHPYVNQENVLFYRVWGSFAVIYYFYIVGMNQRTSQWFTESIKLSKMLSLATHQSNHDVLTGLLNNRGLTNKVIALTNSSEKTLAFTVICISLNKLEYANNSFGYEAADSIIRTTTNRLTPIVEFFQNNDQITYTFSRPRHDVFIIILENAEESILSNILTKIENSFSDPFQLPKTQPIIISASIGVSQYPGDVEKYSDKTLIVGHAYAAMFFARQKMGGTHLEFFQSEMTGKTPKLFELETELSQALKRNEISVVYQPIVNLKTKKIEGLEALARWNNKKNGSISPGQFIPLAEESGLIVPISDFVMGEAIRQTVEFHQQGFRDLKISINLSSYQLKESQSKLLESISRHLNELKDDFNAEHLELELVENAVFNEAFAPTIKALNKMGVGLAIDDFGTGYSNFGYLLEFHAAIKKLKIDQSFIRKISQTSESKYVVKTLINLAKELDLSSLAEGVETKEELDFLRENGCEYIQGYYFSKPLPPQEILALLKKGVEEKCQ